MPRWITILRLIFQLIWSIRGLVIFSFIAHLALALLAGVRRRQATSVWTPILWAANEFARWAPITALGMLSVGSTPQEEQLVTLWVAFMLLHVGRPDNITAYSLEDTVLSRRQKAEVLYQLVGSASPAPFLMKNIFGFSNGGDAMLWVSSVICVMSIVKYLEGAFSALSRGNLKNMRSTRKKKNKSPGRRNGLQIAERGGREPNDEQILLAAHDLLYITQDAFIDYLDDKNDEDADDEQEAVLSDKWDKTLYKVVNMELSLMYDLIYTKAAMVHRWMGYAIRFASPIAGATAFVLFWFHSKEGQAAADVIITYVLLAGTVILDIKWLLRAVASTWFYSFLNERPRSWLHHALLCSGKWRLLRRLIVSDLNLFRFIANEKPTSYRMWSGTIGQYNLLEECTRDENETRTKTTYISSLLMRCAPEDVWMEYEYQRVRGTDILLSTYDIEKLFFGRIWEDMKSAFQEGESLRKAEERNKKGEDEDHGQLPRYMNILNIALDFTPDLQETILILHIATEIFLLLAESDTIEASSKSRQHVKAIKALSNYMMFLVAVRPSMLPGLVLASRYESVREGLTKKWEKNKFLSSSTTREKCLANILISDMMGKKEIYEWHIKRLDELKSTPGGFLRVLHDTSNIVFEGTMLANFLLRRETIHAILDKKFRRQFPELMKLLGSEHDKQNSVTEIIFNEWVRQLINVSIRCTRDSHAKQLARGGELTTVVWILAEHARKLHIKNVTGKKPGYDRESRIDVPPY